MDLRGTELDSGDFDMECISSFENQRLKKKLIFADYNILANGIRGENIGFIMMINELSRDDYVGEKYSHEEFYNNLFSMYRLKK